MTSSLDFSVAAAEIFAMNLDRIIFSGLNSDDKLALTFDIAQDSGLSEIKDSWSSDFYADNNGNILISSLGKIWNDHIMAYRYSGFEEENLEADLERGIYVRITYVSAAATASCIRHIFYARRVVSMIPGEMSSYWPILERKKRTFSDAKEMIYLLGSGTHSVKAGVAYLYNNTASYTEVALSVGSGKELLYLNVSPATVKALALADYPGAVLLYYDVYILDGSGNIIDQVRYTPETRNYPQRTELIYCNMLGAYESIHFLGREEYSQDRNATYGYAGDDYSAMDLEVNDTYTLNTGYCNGTRMNQVRDLLESPVVWLLYEGSIYRKITITDKDFTRTRPSNEPDTAKITYRFADEAESSYGLVPWDQTDKIFSHPPFDRTFA